MKLQDSPSNGQVAAPEHSSASAVRHRQNQYHRARDERKRAIRGLWLRNGRYYAQITLEDAATGAKKVRRILLEDVATAAQARQKLEELRVKRRNGHLPITRRAPGFATFADEYLAYHRAAHDAKRASTMETEKYAINQWKAHLGTVRLDKIRRAHVDAFIAQRQSKGMSARTVNLEVTVLRNVLKKAIDDRWLSSLPTENLRPLKSKPAKRRFYSSEEIEALCAAAFNPLFLEGGLVAHSPSAPRGRPLVNAQQFSDYIKLMACCGARMSEALRLRWPDVNWDRRQLTIGADGKVKNNKWRVVDFNPGLETHLQDMFARRAPDSDWLFPSPRRGELDRAAKTFRESLRLARTAAHMAGFGFHDCRHHFVSVCVMSGVDYMTIAKWVGHQDGGILIGKVYGHLSNEHAKRQADKLALLPRPLSKDGENQVNRRNVGKIKLKRPHPNALEGV